ncbi:alpha/beta fold hydrolase [Flavobacterium silvaticum]|uniref:Alpha/beta hydrolase n=1 Tax=Flavobacterium silvaticum TaxID=1852020 RepID=A0A972G154_9FLAO|nr:alpha/beta hydrolase [Flavobacterium silvaticum]NMH28536.1 alpha/beta hydrolase [Flavobacterium silvaticum]
MKKVSCILLLMLIGCSQKPSAESQTNPEEKDFVKSFDADLKTTTFGKDDKAGKFYKVRGIKMYVETYGSGEPLLLIHGNGGSINNFIYQIAEFSKYYKVIAVDSRSQGKSIDKKDSLSYEMMADDFADLLKQMKAGPANVVGWSDGGIDALLLAGRHPETVKKIAITGANTFPDKAAFYGNEWENMNAGFLSISKKMKSAEPKSPADSLSYKLQKLMAENPHISTQDLHKIQTPALVIGGDHDMISVAHTTAIFENLPNAQLWIVPNSGHATLVTHATEFNKKVLHFFKSEFPKRKDSDRFF